MAKSRQKRPKGRSLKQRKKLSNAQHWRPFRLAALLGFLFLALVAVFAAFTQTASITFGKTGQVPTPKTVNTYCTNLLTTTDTGTVWADVGSATTAEVLAAARCLPMFQSATEGNDLISQAMQHGQIGDPLLVRPYRHDAGLPTQWVIPVLEENNIPSALLIFMYDTSAHKIRANDFAAVSGNMFYTTHPFPAVNAETAATIVEREQLTTVAPNQASELIYFPNDQSWQQGGASVLDPIWRVPGANGHWYYIDHFGHSHRSNDLTVAAGMPDIPDNVNMQ